MKSLQVVPDQPYFVWQLYVQMKNFSEYGLEKDAVILVGLTVGKKPSPEMEKFAAWTNAEVLYYFDTRTTTNYLSSLRPNILKQYFRDHPYAGTFFYHDQDVIFLSAPNLEAEAGVCYVAAAAKSYTDVSYLKQFKKYIFPSMAEIVGVSVEVIEANDKFCGGAQYIISGVDHLWWEKVERDCEGLYSYMVDITTHGLRKYNPDQELESYHVQVWCADMWAVLWNLLRVGKVVKHHPGIDFSWPWEFKNNAKAMMHNAGITKDNDKDYFNKSLWYSVMPFGQRFDHVSPERVQHTYVEYIHTLDINKPNKTTMQNPKKKILGVFCTTNNIHPDLLNLTLTKIREAQTCAVDKYYPVEIVTCSWQPIPNNPFPGKITPFNNLGHLNYVFQIMQAIRGQEADIVCILEHDVMYPVDYFTIVNDYWDYTKYGLCSDNYIGMNETGYQDVKERHKPFSLMSFAKFYLENQLDRCVKECFSNMNGQYPYGWCYMEPNNKEELAHLPFTDYLPAIHVNMNGLGAWHTGGEKKNHHFTTHCQVCYEENSNGKTFRNDWGDYKQYFTFNK